MDQAALHSQRCGSVTLELSSYASRPALETAHNITKLARFCNWHTPHIAPCMHMRKQNFSVACLGSSSEGVLSLAYCCCSVVRHTVTGSASALLRRGQRGPGNSVPVRSPVPPSSLAKHRLFSSCHPRCRKLSLAGACLRWCQHQQRDRASALFKRSRFG